MNLRRRGYLFPFVNFLWTIVTDTDLGIEGDGYHSLKEDDLEAGN